MSLEVIDWDEAMQQCGDDEEFLRELLGDLRDETDTQMVKIDEIIRVSSFVRKKEGSRPSEPLERDSAARIATRIEHIQGEQALQMTSAVYLQFYRFYSLSLLSKPY